jgi:hypothetical protein
MFNSYEKRIYVGYGGGSPCLYSIKDDDLSNGYDLSRPLDGNAFTAIITTYEWHKLPVAPNLWLALQYEAKNGRGHYYWSSQCGSMQQAMSYARESRCFAVYEAELEKYKVLL